MTKALIIAFNSMADAISRQKELIQLMQLGLDKANCHKLFAPSNQQQTNHWMDQPTDGPTNGPTNKVVYRARVLTLVLFLWPRR